jgi:hypothetical protein
MSVCVWFFFPPFSFSFPILENCANWFEVVAEVFEHYFSIWHVAGLLDMCTKFCWAVYNPYYIIHAEACINWQDVEAHTICSQYLLSDNRGLLIWTGKNHTDLYQQIAYGLLPVKKQWCYLPGLQYMVFSFFKCWYCVLKCNVCGEDRKALQVLSPKSEGYVVQCLTHPEVFLSSLPVKWNWTLLILNKGVYKKVVSCSFDIAF